MTTRLVVLALLFWSCSSNGSQGNNGDSSAKAPVAGNSDGINTIALDTAHIDTSLHHLRTDSAR